MSDDDYFISYSSKSGANAARSIADLLHARGKRAWMAEYEIPPEIHLRGSDDEIDAIIARAVRGSRGAIILSGAKWRQSGWCKKEETEIVRQGLPVFEWSMDVDGVQQISGSTFQRYSDPEAVVETLLPSGHVPAVPAGVAHPTRRIRIYRDGCAVYLSTDDFWPLESGPGFRFGGRIGGREVDLGVLYFYPRRTTGDLIGKSTRDLAQTLEPGDQRANSSQDQDERVVYRDYIRRADHTCRERGMQLRGVHYFNVPSDAYLASTGHFAASVVDEPDATTAGYCGERVYCIRLQDPVEKVFGEIMLMATVKERSPTAEEAEAVIRGLGPELDRFIATVSWQGLCDTDGYWRQRRRLCLRYIANLAFLGGLGAVGALAARHGDWKAGFMTGLASALACIVARGVYEWWLRTATSRGIEGAVCPASQDPMWSRWCTPMGVWYWLTSARNEIRENSARLLEAGRKRVAAKDGEALEYLRRASAFANLIDPDNHVRIEAAVLMGFVHQQRGDLAQAIVEFEYALEMAARRPDIRKELADAIDDAEAGLRGIRSRFTPPKNLLEKVRPFL